MLRVVITTGPAWEPLDGMRRLTNASTGRLGGTLASSLAAVGHQVTLLRGELATAPCPAPPVEIRSFSTNDDLATTLEAIGRDSGADAVLHAAALCDFRRGAVFDDEGVERREAKLSSRSGTLRLVLEPATKVLPKLRNWFPRACLVGWKFELNGGRDDALAAAWRQLSACGTDACVLNGAAWGEGFALCEPPDRVTAYPDAEALGSGLMALLGRREIPHTPSERR